MNHVLLWENILDDVTPVASGGSQSGYPVTNINDWRAGSPYRWRSNSLGTGQYISVDLGAGVTATPNTIAIAGHNLHLCNAAGGTGGTAIQCYVDYSDNGSDWSIAGTVTQAMLADGKAAMLYFGSGAGAHRYWAVVFLTVPTGAMLAYPQVGVIALGRSLLFSEGCQPGLDPYGEEAVTDWATSENGDLLGANLRYRRKSFKMNFNAAGFLVTDFFRKAGTIDFEDFIIHARTKPFFFCWNLTTDPAGETYLCRSKGYVGMPFMATTLRRGLTVEFEACLP